MFKVVVVHNNPENNDAEIISVADFNIDKYREGEGTPTPEGVMGGWQENTNQPFVKEDPNFYGAFKEDDGITYHPITVLASQVVNGVKYEYLALGTSEDETISHFYIITIIVSGNKEITLENKYVIDLSSYTK